MESQEVISVWQWMQNWKDMVDSQLEPSLKGKQRMRRWLERLGFSHVRIYKDGKFDGTLEGKRFKRAFITQSGPQYDGESCNIRVEFKVDKPYNGL